MSETPREVFEDLLDTFSHQHTDDDYPIAEQSWWPAWRIEQLARFNAASDWISVEEQLPEAGDFVLVADEGDPDSVEIGRQHDGAWADLEGCKMHPAYWRPRPLPPRAAS